MSCCNSNLPPVNNDCCTDVSEYTRFAYSSAQSAYANAQNAEQSANDAATTLANVVQKTGDTMTGGLVINVNSPSTALRVTQQGTGVSFIVEDSTNPDTTPFQVDAAGNVSIGTSSTSEKLTVVGGIQSSGAIRTSASGFGIGYSTGAGGTVVQGTSRTTPVTIDKVCGSITMFSAAGSTTEATFTVNNSAVEINDTVIINQRSGMNLYDLIVTAVAAGSFNITFRTTGGTATDAPVINFSVIKAVTI